MRFTRARLGILMTLGVVVLACVAPTRGVWLRRSSAVEPLQLCQERAAVQVTLEGATLSLAGSFSALELPSGALPGEALRTFAARCAAGSCEPRMSSPTQHRLASDLVSGAFTAVSVSGVPLYLGAVGGRRMAWWLRPVRDEAALRAVEAALRPRTPSPGGSTTVSGGTTPGRWTTVRGFGDCYECAPCDPGEAGLCPPKPPIPPVPLLPDVDPETFALPLLDRELLCKARAADRIATSECPAATTCP